MAQYQRLPIYKATYDLLQLITHATASFPKAYKYNLAAFVCCFVAIRLSACDSFPTSFCEILIMKHIKYTYVDAIAGTPVTQAPASNGPAFPMVSGLTYVWARESAYPTDVPEFFGTCPDDSVTAIPGVLEVMLEADWVQQQIDEMRLRVPRVITIRQAKLALLAAGLLDNVEAAVAQADRSVQIEWEYAQEFKRDWPALVELAAALGLSDAALDGLFLEGARL